MSARHIRRVVGALALVAGVGLLTAVPAVAQEHEGEATSEEHHELSPAAEAYIEAVEETHASETEQAELFAELGPEDQEAATHALEEEAHENGGSTFDGHCIAILTGGGSVEDCQKAPNQLVPEKNELIWGGFGFAVVFVFLAWKGYPAIKKTMAARTEKIRGELEGAESAKAEAQGVLDEYRAQLADAKSEAGRIIEEARGQADANKRDAEQRLQGELTAMRERAAADVESAKQQAIADLTGEVTTLAIGAAEVVVGRNLDAATQAQLVEQYITSVASRN